VVRFVSLLIFYTIFWVHCYMNNLELWIADIVYRSVGIKVIKTEKGITDIVSDCSYWIFSLFLFIELLRPTQFNAVFFVSSTSNIRQPAKWGIMGDLTPLQPIAVNIHISIYIFMFLWLVQIYFCYDNTACIGTSTDVLFWNITTAFACYLQ
jgi:hypothetical protein